MPQGCIHRPQAVLSLHVRGWAHLPPSELDIVVFKTAQIGSSTGAFSLLFLYTLPQ